MAEVSPVKFNTSTKKFSSCTAPQQLNSVGAAWKIQLEVTLHSTLQEQPLMKWYIHLILVN